MNQPTTSLDPYDRIPSLPFSWSTDNLAAGECPLEAWRDMLSRLFLPIRVEPTSSDDFKAAIRLAAFGPLMYLEVTASGQWLCRDSEEISARAVDWFFIGTMTRGRGTLHSASGMAEIEEGGVTFTDSDKPYRLEFRDNFSFVVALLPRQDLTALLPCAEKGHGSVIPLPTSAALHAFLSSLASEDSGLQGNGPGDPGRQGRVYDHLLGLVVLEVEHELVSTDPGSARDKDLMQRIKAWLVTVLSRDDLSLPMTAEAFGISERKLQRLFQGQGETFSGWVKTQRMERCIRDMLYPPNADLSISTICNAWGFLDPAYFSRSFRAIYGMPPARYRTAILKNLA